MKAARVTGAARFVGIVRVALVAAALWSLALVVAAVTVPVYSGETAIAETGGADPTGAMGRTSTSATSTSATLVEANGWWGLIVACIPLGACLVVGALLLGSRGRAAQVVAAAVVALLGSLTVLSLLSIGVFLVPAVAALGAAVLAASREGDRTERAEARP